MGNTEGSLRGRVALVTGGGRGIGRAVVVGLAAAGAEVAIVARSADQVEQTAALVAESGGTALALPADVTRPDQVAEVLRRVEDRWGPIEILVNNAAVVAPLGPSVAIDPEVWSASLTTNVAAPVRLTLAVLGPMLARGWGRIVNISSGVAADPAQMVRANAYATTKAALEAHTLNLAAELAGSGVTANVYRPGGVDTAMQAYIRGQDPARIGTAMHERFIDNHRTGALLTPERSAASLLARLSGEANGQIWDAADPVGAHPSHTGEAR